MGGAYIDPSRPHTWQEPGMCAPPRGPFRAGPRQSLSPTGPELDVLQGNHRKGYRHEALCSRNLASFSSKPTLRSSSSKGAASDAGAPRTTPTVRVPRATCHAGLRHLSAGSATHAEDDRLPRIDADRPDSATPT